MFAQVIETTDSLEEELFSCEAAKSELVARQVVILRQLDSAQVALAAGKTMTDWVASRLDLSHQLARDLMFLVKAEHLDLESLLRSGEIGFERALGISRLRQAGASFELVFRSFASDLAGLQRLLSDLRSLTRPEKKNALESPYLVLQPRLDRSGIKFWGVQVGMEAEVIERALRQRSDQLSSFKGSGTSQRLADALASVCADSLTGNDPGPEAEPR